MEEVVLGRGGPWSEAGDVLTSTGPSGMASVFGSPGSRQLA